MRWSAFKLTLARKSCGELGTILTTDDDHTFNIAPNLLKRGFTADRPNQKWACDFSYIWTSEGSPYLAVILNLHSRRVIG